MASLPPAAQAATIHLGHASTLAVGALAIAVAFAYEKFVRKHLWKAVQHVIDILAVIVALDAGVALCTSWPGHWIHSIFDYIAGLWDGNGGTAGTEWVTIAAVVLSVVVAARIAAIAKKEHHGPLGAALGMAIALPLVLAATTGQFGSHVMTALASTARPTLTFLGTW
jgi:hypothetical protein